MRCAAALNQWRFRTACRRGANHPPMGKGEGSQRVSRRTAAQQAVQNSYYSIHVLRHNGVTELNPANTDRCGLLLEGLHNRLLLDVADAAVEDDDLLVLEPEARHDLDRLRQESSTPNPRLLAVPTICSLVSGPR